MALQNRGYLNEVDRKYIHEEIEAWYGWRAPWKIHAFTVEWLGDRHTPCPRSVGGSGKTVEAMWVWGSSEREQWQPWGNMSYRVHRFLQHARLDTEAMLNFVQQPA